MTKRIRIVLVVAVAAITVPALVLAATASYTSPTLKVSYAGSTTVITASAAPADDATAVATIYVPSGTTLTTSQTPGTPIGTVKAQVAALALGGALLPLSGPIIVAPPGAIPAASQQACIQEATPTASWILQLSAAGQTINLPAYVLPTAGAETALGAAKIRFCLAPPDIPVEQGGATFGAKFLSAALSVNGVFSPVAQGAWIAFWTPWQAGNGQLNQAGTVASPAAVAAGAVTVKAKKNGPGAVVTGKVTQGGQPRPGAAVSVWGARGKAALHKLGTVKTTAAGTYTFRARTGDVFQARVVAGSIAAPPLCQLITAQLQGIPCINPTANGFTAKSGSVHKR
jgi:hypothetical protein